MTQAMVDARRMSNRTITEVRRFSPNPKGNHAIFETLKEQLGRIKGSDFNQKLRNEPLKRRRLVLYIGDDCSDDPDVVIAAGMLANWQNNKVYLKLNGETDAVSIAANMLITLM